MKLIKQSINDKRWIASKNQVIDHRIEEALDEQLSYSEAFKRILSRKLDDQIDPEQFLHPSLDQLHNPSLLKDLDKAVQRIQQAIANKEPICIYGDYDVDGITSVSLLIRAFEAIDYPVRYYIPDRHEEGYGLNGSAIEQIAEEGAAVIITVDCGITSVKEAVLARTLGVDLIITDHHECQEEIPSAFAVINPKQEDCSYPFKMLAGVGIAYKLACAILEEQILPVREALLELAAFGTIADIAPLNGENRILAKFGLASLSETKITGFKALIECSDLANKKITAGHVGFMLAPKINAAGRIDDPKQGVVLLTTKDEYQAVEIAAVLKETNDRRQQLEKEILEAAISQIENREDFHEQHVTIAYGEGWNSGVIGIVASRLVEKYHKPSLVFSIMNGKAKGSARSVEGFDIFEALRCFGDLYEKFGGHEQAAGLTICEDRFMDWKLVFEAHCQGAVEEYLLIPAVRIDEVLLSKDVSYDFVEELALLEPYGMGNPRPVFKLENVVIQKKVMLGKNKEFTKFEVADGVRTFEAISFDKSGYYPLYKPGDLVDLVCHVDINEFKGTQTIQFQLKDIRGIRPELCKNNQPLHLFAASGAKRIMQIAQSGNMSALSVVPQGHSEKKPVDQVQVWTVSTQEGLSYFYNKIYDQFVNRIKVVSCNLPQETAPELIYLVVSPAELIPNSVSVEHYFDLSCGVPSLKQVEQWIPERDDLVQLYKAIRQQAYEQNLPDSVNAWLSILVLEDAKLIEIDDGKIHLLPSPQVKIDLMERPVFKALQSLKNSLKNL